MIIPLGPLEFLYIVDLRSNITRVEVGPQNLVIQSHEKSVGGPLPCVLVPPGFYCVIRDPIKIYEHGERAELSHGYCAVKLHQPPFPLYPGESLEIAENFVTTGRYEDAIRRLPVVPAEHALKVKARYDYTDAETGERRCADDIWHIEGPRTYIPVAEVIIQGIVKPQVVLEHEALRLRANRDLVDRDDKTRVTGEEWLVRRPGAYLPGAYEEVVRVEKAICITENKAVHVRADMTFKDSMGKSHRAGDEWLVSVADTTSYIPDVGLEVVSLVDKTVLQTNQYCVVLDPVDSDGVNQLGKRQLRKGPASFFLLPGEKLEHGIQTAYVLAAEEAIVLVANDVYEQKTGKKKIRKQPGDRWMITGPCSFIPSIEVSVVEHRKAMALKENEGIYVRDIETGQIRTVLGPISYLLKANEELWEKILSEVMEEVLKNGGGKSNDPKKTDIRKMAYFEQSIDPSLSGKRRDRTRVVTFRCPHNTAVQVYDYQHKKARVIYGPDLAVLGPYENFTLLRLSAGKPKKPDALITICLMLGPDFITDDLELETSDHARLRIRLAFNNHFEFDRNDAEADTKIFSVPDFIGYACRHVGSAIRAAVAGISFDEFHRNSSLVIKEAVFGRGADGKMRNSIKFAANGLVISSVDVQSVEPVDSRMRDSLLKSIQLAIEISTKSIERSAEHEASRREQQARGALERQKLNTEKESEVMRTELHQLRAVTAAVESTGQAKAEAAAQAEKLLIEGQAEITKAKLVAEAAEIEHTAQLAALKEQRTAELEYDRAQAAVELRKASALCDIEVNKMADMVQAIGKNTLTAVATAGPEMKVKLLQGLGIESTLITDGNSPINLFTTANDLLGSATR